MDVWRRHACEVVNWASHIEVDLGLYQGRSFFDSQSTLMGGFDNRPGTFLYTASREEIEKEIFTPEEIAESDLRVALISELIDARNEKEISQIEARSYINFKQSKKLSIDF